MNVMGWVRSMANRMVAPILRVLNPYKPRKGSMEGFRDWELWEATCPKDSPFPRRDGEQRVHTVRFLILGETVSIGAESVLDCGCGIGVDYSFFKNTPVRYTGIDITPRFLARARRDYPDIDVREVDILNMPFNDGSFDVVYCKDVLEHVPPEVAENMINRMWQVAKKRLMIAFFRPPSDEPEDVGHKDLGFFYNRYNKQKILTTLRSLPGFVEVHVIEEVGDNDSALYVVDKEFKEVRILIVGDQPNWSGDITVSNLIKNIGPEFKCDKIFGLNALKEADATKYDVIYIHCVWRDLLVLLEDCFTKLRTENPEIKILGGIRGEAGFQGNKDHLHMLDGVNTNNLERMGKIKEIRDDVFLCHSAVDTEMFKPMKNLRGSRFTVLWAGDMKKKVKNWEIVPKLGFKYKLATKSECVKLDPNARCYKYKDMPQFYNSGDVFVLPSESEGSPNTLVEAMACCLPVLVFRTAGAAVEYLDDYQLVNDTEEMKQKLKELALDPDLRQRLGEENRKNMLESWSWKIKVNQYKDFFMSVL